MNLRDKASIFRFHNALIQEYGVADIAALGWKSRDAQLARYKILVGIADLNDRTVLDVGCGHGDLRPFLGKHYPNLHYLGIEQVPALLDIAIKRYGHLPETLFFEGDFSIAQLPVADYVIACGALSYRNSDPFYIFKMIEKLFNSCTKGFAFNLLSKTEIPGGIITSYLPAEIIAFCNKLSNNIKFVDAYWEDDFTVMMYH
ncbi:MAG: class I SAM-dependent methyltransferase [Ferruginibacter sp.]